MTVNNFVFTPADGLRNAVNFKTTPDSEADARDQVQDISDQIRDYINNTIITELNNKLALSGGNLTGDLSTTGKVTATGTQTGSALVASGLTGATAASRYVGATTSGAPTSGTFAKGDFVIDQTGAIWVCVTAGTPGAWKNVSVTQGNTSAFRAYQSTAQAALVANTWTKVLFQTEEFDNQNEYDTATSRFTATNSGIYTVGCAVTWALTLGSTNKLAVYKNGVLFAYLLIINNVNNATFAGNIPVKLAAGDYIEIYANSSGTPTFSATSPETYFAVAKVG